MHKEKIIPAGEPSQRNARIARDRTLLKHFFSSDNRYYVNQGLLLSCYGGLFTLVFRPPVLVSLGRQFGGKAGFCKYHSKRYM
jgi:hypothetical protein